MTEAQQQKIIRLARSLVGAPYVYGAEANAPHTFDCSSFTQYVFKGAGIELPRSSILQAADGHGTELAVSNDPSHYAPGDLLFMRGVRGFYRDSLFEGREVSIGHVGIYLGTEEIAHAQAHREPNGVVIQNLSELTRDPHYAIIFAKRF